jgi:hypothetical protein
MVFLLAGAVANNAGSVFADGFGVDAQALGLGNQLVSQCPRGFIGISDAYFIQIIGRG